MNGLQFIAFMYSYLASMYVGAKLFEWLDKDKDMAMVKGLLFGQLAYLTIWALVSYFTKN